MTVPTDWKGDGSMFDTPDPRALEDDPRLTFEDDPRFEDGDQVPVDMILKLASIAAISRRRPSNQRR